MPKPKSKAQTVPIKNQESSVSVLLVWACLMAVIAWWTARKQALNVETVLARNAYTGGRMWVVPCHKEVASSEACKPRKCGRYVQDGLLRDEDVDVLATIADRLIHVGKPLPVGPSIFDIASGAVTYSDKFINTYKLGKSLVSADEKKVLQSTYATIEQKISELFECRGLYLAAPSFFSRIQGGNFEVTSPNQEYYHEHVDELQYGSFDYTALVYLSSFQQDFTGGEFSFNGQYPLLVQPKKGRFSTFTSSSENPHQVHKVLNGTRLAFTVAFTCNQEAGIPSAWEQLIQ
jgi:hypothetical protein